MNQGDKKHKKQVERKQKKLADKKKAENREREFEIRSQYPPILISPTDGDPEFVNLIKDATKQITFDEKTFGGGALAFYKMIRAFGFSEALRVLNDVKQQWIAEGDIAAETKYASAYLGYGMHLLSKVPEADRRRLMPYNDVMVRFENRMILLTFSSLKSVMGSQGNIYFGKRQPTIDFDGKTYQVGFTRHAIEHICERINPGYINYGAAGDIHAFFNNCIYFEPTYVKSNKPPFNDDQPAFILFDLCDNPAFAQYSHYVEDIYGVQNIDPTKGKCYYKVGYCTVEFERGFAIATTFLCSGFSATPEYRFLKNANVSESEKEKMIKDATGRTIYDDLFSPSLDTIKWLHHNGIPQVRQMTRKVFEYDTVPPMIDLIEPDVVTKRMVNWNQMLAKRDRMQGN